MSSIEIAEECSERILNLLEEVGRIVDKKQKEKKYEIYTKDDGTIVTDLDYLSNDLIFEGLSKIFGDISIVSEENDFNDNIEISKKDNFFLLDPIDGTKSFNQGGDFTINLAFCVNKEAKIGFIHSPRNKISTFNNSNMSFIKKDKKISQIKIEKQKLITQKEINIITGTTAEFALLEKFFTLAQKNGYNCKISHQSAMEKIFSLISNESNLMILIGKYKDWDILPAIPILKNAGFFYSNLKEDKFYVHQNDEFLQNIFLTSKSEIILEDFEKICLEIL